MAGIPPMPDIASYEGVAKPGDLDLDFDMDAMTVTSVTNVGDELVVELSGGFGTWSGKGGEPVCWSFVDGTGESVQTSLTAWFPDAPREWLDTFVAQFHIWRAEGTLLRLCSAPGRSMGVIADVHEWLPFPRRSIPDCDYGSGSDVGNVSDFES